MHSTISLHNHIAFVCNVKPSGSFFIYINIEPLAGCFMYNSQFFSIKESYNKQIRIIFKKLIQHVRILAFLSVSNSKLINGMYKSLSDKFNLFLKYLIASSYSLEMMFGIFLFSFLYNVLIHTKLGKNLQR